MSIGASEAADYDDGPRPVFPAAAPGPLDWVFIIVAGVGLVVEVYFALR